MKILVCGVGSIGERHLRNLIELGHEEIAVYRRQARGFRNLEREFPTFTDLGEALGAFSPEVAFVTNPTALRASVALQCAQAGCHLFLEKPVSHNLELLDVLQQALQHRDRVAMVGYMLRFHPLFQLVKSWVEQGEASLIGRAVAVRSTWGEHVADWHPWEDYRESYAARPDLGGGPALTLSHDFDLLVWMFGPPLQTIGLTHRNGPIEAECEHAVDALLHFESGVTANVHLDYFQRPPLRSWEIVGMRGRAVVDVLAGQARLWTGDAIAPEIFEVPPGFDRNDLFLGELRYFFDCLQSGTVPLPGIAEAAESVRIAQQATGSEE